VAGGWALLVMALSMVGPNAINAYTGMLALASIVSCVRDVRHSLSMRVIGSVLLIAAGTGCALLGYKHFVTNLSNFLAVLLFVFIPWSAINLTDYYLVKRGQYDVPSFFDPRGRYGRFLWPGLLAYVLAMAVEFPFIDQTFYTGLLVKPLGGIDVSWVVGGVAGVVFYLIALQISAPAVKAASGSKEASRPRR
jgi:nucleobase:cation symporter-1, NCS1 family